MRNVFLEVKGKDIALKAMSMLIAKSQWARCSPCPNDVYSIEVKKENLKLLAGILAELENIDEPALFILIHTHEYGTTPYPFYADADWEIDVDKHIPILINHFAIDFEPDTENLDIVGPVDLGSATTVERL